jgi:hypothetical protein
VAHAEAADAAAELPPVLAAAAELRPALAAEADLPPVRCRARRRGPEGTALRRARRAGRRPLLAATARPPARLEAAGLVARDRDPQDRRRYALRTTPAGRQALGAGRRMVEAAEGELGAALGADARAELKALLITLLRVDA